MANEVRIDIGNGLYLVAQQNEHYDYRREIFIGIQNRDGWWLQDLAVVRNAYRYDESGVVWRDGDFEVLVYGNSEEEDYTERFGIGLREDVKEDLCHT